ncbi:MAG: ATP-dependent DNA helicase RecG [Alphaproteobacteria bacterium]|nr:ATP-dependent DNA helicase RecG [Alphaproteobacteria bacterium]
MRPEILFPLFAPVTALSGIGPRLGKLVKKAVGAHVVDLLWHLPAGLIDRRYAPKIRDAIPGRVATITVKVWKHEPPHNPRRPYKVICADETGTLQLVFFNARQDWLTKLLPPNETRVVSGQIEAFNDQLQMGHPDHIVTVEEAAGLQAVEPVYPLTAGLTLKIVGKAIRAALARAPELPEWQDPAWLKQQGWTTWRAALTAAHGPEGEADLEPTHPVRQRLAYDELLANQLALALVRAHQRKLMGRVVAGDGRLRALALAALPYELTGSQKNALAEILADMAEPLRMLRLLQGDVGSGKTIVALLAMLNAVETGAQAALMAPTEILARQHFQTIAPIAAASGVRIALLTGRDRGKARAAVLDGLAGGTVDIAIGTHALFQDEVEFHDLALAVIDEQHRFGVHQRVTLAAKGKAVDMLVMTATPIPRTLKLTAYGDLDASRLTEKPAGRQPIDTRTVPLDRMAEVVDAVGRAVVAGAKVYWVCPLVEESELTDLAAAADRQAELRGRFGERVGLVHGQMKGPERDRAMEAFATPGGGLDILVATTVIEVGVDVPDATIMVIEHAERFGLAQLHQLRGRIGRGQAKSTCILLYQTPLTEVARSRLQIIRETEDGFRIAEEDLRLRGAGELLGTRQSGLPEFRLANLAVHGELLAAARDDVKLIQGRDPDLMGERGKALRVLLYLFQRDAAVKNLRSG